MFCQIYFLKFIILLQNLIHSLIEIICNIWNTPVGGSNTRCFPYIFSYDLQQTIKAGMLLWPYTFRDCEDLVIFSFCSKSNKSKDGLCLCKYSADARLIFVERHSIFYVTIKVTLKSS